MIRRTAWAQSHPPRSVARGAGDESRGGRRVLPRPRLLRSREGEGPGARRPRQSPRPLETRLRPRPCMRSRSGARSPRLDEPLQEEPAQARGIVAQPGGLVELGVHPAVERPRVRARRTGCPMPHERDHLVELLRYEVARRLLGQCGEFGVRGARRSAQRTCDGRRPAPAARRTRGFAAGSFFAPLPAVSSRSFGGRGGREVVMRNIGNIGLAPHLPRLAEHVVDHPDEEPEGEDDRDREACSHHDVEQRADASLIGTRARELDPPEC